MKGTDVNANLVNTYLDLLSNLSMDVKLEIISKLLESMASENGKTKESILGLYGSWASDQSAEELIEEIRSSRLFNRQIEPL